MGKKQKLQHHQEIGIVEEREPAAYSLHQDEVKSGSRKKQKRAAAPEPPQLAVAAAAPAGAAADAAEQQQQQQQQYEGHEDANGDGWGAGYGGDDDGYYNQAAGGSRVDPETLSYLTEVCEHLSQVAGDPEEAALLRANVLEELAGRELRIATDAASSKLLEQLLYGAPAQQLMQFLGAFGDEEQLWRLAGGAFGSHVAEKVLAWLHQAASAAEAAAAAAAAAGSSDGDQQAAAAAAAAEGAETLEALRALLEGLLDALEPHLLDYATDKHATHVARALLVVLAGWDVLTPPGKKHAARQKQAAAGEDEEEGGAGGQHAGGDSQQQPYIQVSFGGKARSSLAEKLAGASGSRQAQAQARSGCAAVRFPGLLKRFIRALPCHDPPTIATLGKNSAGGPLLQAMLRAATHDPELLMLLLPPILGLEPSKAAAAQPGQRLATLTDSSVGRLLRDDCYSHLLEVAVTVMPAARAAGDDAAAGGSSSSLADEFHDRFFKGRLLPLCHHHCANFVIQAAIAAAQSSSRVAAFVTELAPHLPDLLKRRRSGVVAALAAAAGRAGPGPHQEALITALAAALSALPQWSGRSGTSHLAPALLTLDTLVTLGGAGGSGGRGDGNGGRAGRLSTPGCALLAMLLGGQFPAKTVAPFIGSLAQLGPADVLRVAKDPAGSRVLQALLVVPATEQPSAAKKRKQKKKQQREGGEGEAAAAAAADGGDELAAAARAQLMSRLAGGWGGIALLPAGSFLLEAVFMSLPLEQQEALVAEVARSHDSLISRCRWGPLLARKLGLEAYLRSPEEWRKRTASAASARKSFEALLTTSQQPKQQQQQQQDGGGDGGSKKDKKKRKRDDAASPTAAAAAALAAASNEKPTKKQRKQQQQQQQQRGGGSADVQMQDASPQAAAADGSAGDDTEMRSASKTGSGKKQRGDKKDKSKRKRSTSNGPEDAGAAAGVVGAAGGDVMALLGFGGLSAGHGERGKQRSKKKQRH